MSKIIKYNDYIQVNPDERILSLDKKDKIAIIDNMLSSAFSGGKGLIVTYDLSHSGRRINNRIYSTKGQQRGIESLTEPYPKPILKNHDQKSEPIGRFIGGEWQNLYDQATEYLQSSQAALDVHNAFVGDDPGKIYHAMKSFNLIEDKKWPGLGRMRVQANITDEEAIKKFMDGRYLTFSAGSTTNRHVCSICETDWALDGMCEHRHGQEYDGETCVFITGDFIVLEGSVVNTPADDLSQLIHMELRDSEEDYFTRNDSAQVEEIIFTDSTYNLGDENGVQATKQIDAYKEETKKEEKEEVAKQFDHEMSISEKAMLELHNEGETYITQRGDNQTMIIKVKYSGSMRKDLSNPKQDDQKDLIMEEQEILEVTEEVAETDSSKEDIEVLEEVVETTEEEQAPQEESLEDSKNEEEEDEEETLDPPQQEDSQDIDWEILDLALSATMHQQDAQLTTEQRNELPDSAFCGPDRSFPVPDCAHVTAARRLIGRAKVSDSVKKEIMSCVDAKASNMKCDRSEDYLELEARYSDLLDKYNSLEEKLAVIVDSVLEKKTSISEEKVAESVENATEEQVLVNDVKVESPSEHISEDESEQKMSKKPTSNLGSFEQKVVDTYNMLKKDHGELSAENYLVSKASYLPRGFHPNNI